ncbi:hypothetical protein ACLQ2P_41740 [Actinomadura citrea]|uniref:hypothetical protein n=1 Tax=Actinomadura citrea TaxID=46158 RepID=UPI003CE5669A
MKPPPRIVVDPDLAPDVRALLVEWENARFKLHELRDLPPLPEGEAGERLPLVTPKTMAVVGLQVVLAVVLAVAFGWSLFLPLLVIPLLTGAGMVVWGLGPRAARDRVLAIRRAYDQYVLASDLDEESRELLARAHEAVRAVLRSQVHADGTLDHIRNEVVLPRAEWEIASALRGVSTLRARHPDLAGKAVGDAGRTLAATVRAVRDRVTALEAYAEQVKAADAAALLPGQHSTADLDTLTAQARAATASLRQDVQLPELS